MFINFKLTSMLSKFIRTPRSGRSRSRSFVTAAPRPLQDKETAETCQNIKEAADAVKEGAKEVRETSEFIKDTAASAAKKVTKMTKEVTERVTEATDAIKEKTVDSVSGAWGTAKATTEIIKDKIVGK
ncbi:hypothetical protein K2173_003658 [Erythroxylum novogranatense]|uniref:Uncharacterized protein n=1 Tax=Erythroxylum novogranatense TaxID=1862640 RepID=A0AAV8TBY5_9ROSI|nr:hypothetical protein K2173_003658 [Erythroxylum novogranatense]